MLIQGGNSTYYVRQRLSGLLYEELYMLEPTGMGIGTSGVGPCLPWCWLLPLSIFLAGKGWILFASIPVMLWDFSCLIKSMYIIYFINFFTIHLLDKVVIDEKVKLTHIKYGQFSWKFPISLFKMIRKLWFKKCCENTYLQV